MCPPKKKTSKFLNVLLAGISARARKRVWCGFQISLQNLNKLSGCWERAASTSHFGGLHRHLEQQSKSIFSIVTAEFYCNRLLLVNNFVFVHSVLFTYNFIWGYILLEIFFKNVILFMVPMFCLNIFFCCVKIKRNISFWSLGFMLRK